MTRVYVVTRLPRNTLSRMITRADRCVFHFVRCIFNCPIVSVGPMQCAVPYLAIDLDQLFVRGVTIMHVGTQRFGRGNAETEREYKRCQGTCETGPTSTHPLSIISCEVRRKAVAAIA